ncbi:hypothetical protein PZE06_24005 [Robertmurraya sp. DFI.2.37]|jgi:hypothetical protein|uniref:hypothetical protein n=1 Tax=Robertmurraya sp. DFI.2.37 TaxID=3031819 RepID=UPI00124754EA|nr:hypothetical protein [Robertmurraya sp. DFI.2.37]MDF1511200.1 hypothetical protein [Robertmurraya sp. DFI.2.37]
MKKIISFVLLLIWLSSSTAQALSWAYPFVVWEGKVYEVKQEEFIDASKIGKIIGKVKTTADDMTGEYYGDASNYYPIGTEYFAIQGVSVSSAIAVKENEKWIKAVYVNKAPFHIMNIVSNFYFLSALVICILIITTKIVRKLKS